MTSISDNSAQRERANRLEQLSPVERQNRTKAVDTLLNAPEDLNDILESELWTLREQLQNRS